MDYKIYDSDPGYSALEFSEIFYDVTDFVEKVISVGTDTTNLADLYRILAQKYSWATTRYMMEEAFILALKRELEIAWPTYIRQKTIVGTIYDLTVAEIMLQMEQIQTDTTNSSTANTSSVTTGDDVTVENSESVNSTDLENIVNANNSPVTNASTIPIANKSNAQKSNKGNKTQANLSTTSGSGTNVGTSSNITDGTGLANMKLLSNKLDATTKQYEAVAIDYLEKIYRKVDPLFRVIL